MKPADSWSFTPIAYVESCFKEKFSIPRQPGLVPAARATIVFNPECAVPGGNWAATLEGLEEFSHLWVVFVFHEAGEAKARIRPPRLGGAKKVGVLASRSPHRPNPIGLSVVKIEKIIQGEGVPRIEITGHDFLNGTPVLDIKPYLPYADQVEGATSGWAQEPIERVTVTFTEKAKEAADGLGLTRVISETLALDPRPAFQKRKLGLTEGKKFGCLVQGWDVKWIVRNGGFEVTALDHQT